MKLPDELKKQRDHLIQQAGLVIFNTTKEMYPEREKDVLFFETAVLMYKQGLDKAFEIMQERERISIKALEWLSKPDTEHDKVWTCGLKARETLARLTKKEIEK